MIQKVITILTLSVLVLGFQNCGNSSFERDDITGSGAVSEPSLSKGKSFKITDFIYHQNIKIEANFAQHMASHDLDGDGDLDLVLAESTKNKITLVLNDGAGNFTIQTSLPTTSRVYSRILTEDLNNDGKYDLITASQGGVLHIWLNDGSNNFPSRLDVQTGAPGAGAVNFLASGDVNNDGYKDIAVANTSSSVSGSVAVLINDGLGGMLPPVSIGVGLEPYGVALVDLNNNTYSDLVFTSRLDHKVYIYKNTLGVFSLEDSFIGSTDPGDSQLTDLVTTDLDQDGKMDLVWGSECRLGKLECHKSNYDQKIYVAYGAGGLSFDEMDHHSTGAYGDVRSLGLFDVNLDGKMDVMAIDDINTNPFAGQGEYSSISFFINKGKKKFKKVQNKMLSREVDESGVETAPGSSYSNSFAFGDFNGDGLVDFAADAKINGAKNSSGTRVYLGKKKKDDDPIDVPL